ncbi:MAG TPA: SAM-dependent methyltransferase [Candidatus Ozemobacteraceae bacterium]
MRSGLYARLIEDGLLIRHEETGEPPLDPEGCFRVIRPETVRFISHPCEWSFSQLRDAARAALALQSLAMNYGMRLKDASAFNFQLHEGRIVLLDTLSFEKARADEPWPAYQQFCRHFLAPLALMSRVDVSLGRLSQLHLDGIPLDLASRLLPLRTWFSFQLLMHLHLHARAQSSLASDTPHPAAGRKVHPQAVRGIVDGLQSAIEALDWHPAGTTWAEYYTNTNYSETGFTEKRELVAGLIDRVSPGTAWDLGANTGVFSRLASERGALTVAWDIDPAAVERNYRDVRSRGDTRLLPLLLDLTNPTPAFGWAHTERASFADRGPVDLVMALALIHHLVIGNNLPFDRVAAFLAGLGRHLIIEFVPREDSQVQRLLAVRKDIFTGYSQAAFEASMACRFDTLAAMPVRDTKRTLFLMKSRECRC